MYVKRINNGACPHFHFHVKIITITIITITLITLNSTFLQCKKGNIKIKGKLIYSVCNRIYIYDFENNRVKMIYEHKRPSFLQRLKDPAWIYNAKYIIFDYNETVDNQDYFDDEYIYTTYIVNKNGKNAKRVDKIGYNKKHITSYDYMCDCILELKSCKVENVKNKQNISTCDSYIWKYDGKKFNRKKKKRMYLMDIYDNAFNNSVYIMGDNVYLRKPNKLLYKYRKDISTFYDIRWSNDNSKIAILVNLKSKTESYFPRGFEICIYDINKRKLICNKYIKKTNSDTTILGWSPKNNSIAINYSNKYLIFYNINNNTFNVIENNDYLLFSEFQFIDESNVAIILKKPYESCATREKNAEKYCDNIVKGKSCGILFLLNKDTRKFTKLSGANLLGVKSYSIK